MIRLDVVVDLRCWNCRRLPVDHDHADDMRCIGAPYPGATGDHYTPRGTRAWV